MATGTIRITTTIEITTPLGIHLEPITVRKTVTGITAIDPLRSFAFTAAQSRTIYDPTVEATENMTTWDGLIAWTNGTIDFECTANEGDANERLCVHRLVAELPLMIGADDSFYGATGGLGGTADVTDKIRAAEAGSSTADLHFTMWKV